MNKAFKLFSALLLLLALFSAGTASAQSSDISPYSRYGIGDLQDQSSVLNFSMGGTGIAYHNDSITPFFINLKNPASYAYGFIPYQDTSGKGGIKMASFETGIVDNILKLSTEGQTSKSNNAYLSYIVLNMPVSRHVGLSMGLTPVSSLGYNISQFNTVDSITVQNQYQGIGGFNKVFLGGAYSPFKGLSLGANISYIFGNLTNEEDIYFPNSNQFSTLKLENVGVHSFYADFGMMYSVTLYKCPDKDHQEKNWYATIGLTYAPPINLNANYSSFSGSQYYNGSSIVNMDTLTDTSYVGKLKMPAIYGAGITIKKGEKWTFSFDYTMSQWSQYSDFGQSENLINSYKYGVGIQYVPKKMYATSYFQRIHYRLGASYGQNYLDLYNTPLKDMSVSAGLGLPVGLFRPYKRSAVVNLGIQVGSMGTTSNNLIKQDYVKLMFGFTFDDSWFEKQKFY